MVRRLLADNIGANERWLRIILGVAVLSLVFIGPRSSWGFIGLVPLLTGLVGTCPLYSVFGVSTLRHATRDQQTGRRVDSGW